VAQNNRNRTSAIDSRTTRHGGYEVNRRKRKRIEESFGWMKIIGMLKKVKLRGWRKWIGGAPSWPRPTTCTGCRG
jgi:hypothetical protein